MSYLINMSNLPPGCTPADIDAWDDAGDDLDPDIKAELEALEEQEDNPDYMM
jgi:hypothetical protein